MQYRTYSGTIDYIGIVQRFTILNLDITAMEVGDFFHVIQDTHSSPLPPLFFIFFKYKYNKNIKKYKNVCKMIGKKKRGPPLV